ncbi:MAG: cupin domain-containing protein [Actinomycetota bacterium]
MPIARKNIQTPDEVRRIPSGNAIVSFVNVESLVVMQGEMKPGWRWSNDLRPMVGTPSCEIEHTGVILDGTLHVELDDGTTQDLSSGDVYVIPSRHDAWVVGNEPVRLLDWSQAVTGYEKGKR